MTEYAIELNGVRKAYDKLGFKKRLVNALTLRGFAKEKTTALNQASLKVRQGEIFGLLGPNGAGKTTMIKILTTILTPDSGTATVDGFNVVNESLKVRERIGVLYEDSEKGFGMISAGVQVITKRWDLVTWFFTMLGGPLSGVWFPYQLLPPSLQTLSNLMPQTYILDMLRRSMLRSELIPSLWESLYPLLITAIIIISIGSLVYLRSINYAKKYSTIGEF